MRRLKIHDFPAWKLDLLNSRTFLDIPWSGDILNTTWLVHVQLLIHIWGQRSHYSDIHILNTQLITKISCHCIQIFINITHTVSSRTGYVIFIIILVASFVRTAWPLSRQCEFPDGSRHSVTFGMLSVTHIMPVLVLLSMVGVGMQQYMIWNHIFNISDRMDCYKIHVWTQICSLQ